MQELPAYMLVAIFQLIYFFHVEQYNESNNRETMQCKVKVKKIKYCNSKK